MTVSRHYIASEWSLATRRTNVWLQGWNHPSYPWTSGERRGPGDWAQSSVTTDLINNADIMKPPGVGEHMEVFGRWCTWRRCHSRISSELYPVHYNSKSKRSAVLSLMNWYAKSLKLRSAWWDSWITTAWLVIWEGWDQLLTFNMEESCEIESLTCGIRC